MSRTASTQATVRVPRAIAPARLPPPGGLQLDRASLLFLASAEPFDAGPLLDLVAREEVVARAFAGRNTTGGKQRDHTAEMMTRSEQVVASDPRLARLLAPILPLKRIAAALHDVGKTLALQSEHHSFHQQDFTARLLAELLPAWGFTPAEQRLIAAMIDVEISDPAAYRFRPSFDAAKNRERLRRLVASMPGVGTEVALASALVSWIGDGACYPDIVAGSLERHGHRLRIRGDEPVQLLRPLLAELAPRLPLDAFFAPPAPRERLSAEAARRRWHSRTATTHWGNALASGAGLEAVHVRHANRELDAAGVVHRIAVDARDLSPQAWQARRAHLARELAGVDGRRTAVFVHTTSVPVMQDVLALVHGHGAGAVLLTDVDVLDPKRGLVVPPFDMYLFDNLSRPDTSRRRLAELTGLS